MFRSSDLQRDCKQKTSCFNQLKGQLAAGGGLGGAGGQIHQQISWPIDPIDDREVTRSSTMAATGPHVTLHPCPPDQ